MVWDISSCRKTIQKSCFVFFQSWFSHEVDKTLPGGPNYGARPYGCRNRRRLMTSN